MKTDIGHIKITAGIVLYNPEIERLRQNIAAIYPQVERLVLVDNGSTDRVSIEVIAEDYSSLEIVYLGENLGIAAAQNVMCRWAIENDFDWLVTLDQDSVSPNGLVEEYQRIISDPTIAMVCPRVIDRNFGEIYSKEERPDVEDVEECIASASAIRLSAWNEVGGFYEPLFIDKVDFDICRSLHERGYHIVRTNKVQLLHEVGHSRIVHYAGKDWLLLNHSPLRYYYIIRNAFIVGRRHGGIVRLILRDLRTFYQVIRFENNKFEKAKMMLVGFYHGIVGKKGKYGK